MSPKVSPMFAYLLFFDEGFREGVIGVAAMMAGSVAIRVIISRLSSGNEKYSENSLRISRDFTSPLLSCTFSRNIIWNLLSHETSFY